MERLQKIIADSGYCSRRKAEELIVQGDVSVDGQIIRELGFKADRSADIRISGKALKDPGKVVYLLNKPRRVISSASDDRGRTTVVDLIDSPYRLYPLVRLDYDSSGLILLSNDGELMQKLIHPRYEVEKAYEVTVDSLVREEEIGQLEKGVRIEDYVSGKAKIEVLERSFDPPMTLMEVTIHEGKNREIRKMFEAIGHRVVKLQRVKEADLTLDGLKSGEYSRLDDDEIRKLYEYLDHGDD